MVHVITYDLHKPERDYEKVSAVIKTADGGWAHPQGSVWFVDTLKSPSDWVERLRRTGDPNDEFFVARLQHNWASINMDNDVVVWLNDPRRRW
jgi:hypothetical protein